MCARFLGDQSQTCFIHESGNYASTSGAGVWLGMVQNCDIKDEVGLMSVRYNHGASRNVGQFVQTTKKVSTSLSLYPQDWRLLAFTLGSCVDTSGTNSTHVISEVNSDSSNAFTSGTRAPFMSFAIEDAKRFNPTGLNHVKTAYGNIINELTINLPRGDAITLDVDARAQYVGYASGAATATTASTTLPYLSQHATWSLPSGTNTVIAEVNSSVIRINNNVVAEVWQNGSNVVTLPYPTNRDYSVELKVDGNTNWAKTFYDQYFKGGSSFNLQVHIAPAATRFCDLTFSGCVVPNMADPTTFTGGQEQTITITPQSMSAAVTDQVVKYNPW